MGAGRGMLEKYGKRDRENKRYQEMEDDMAIQIGGKTTHKSDATGVEGWAISREVVTSADM